MPRQRRVKFPGCTLHLTDRGNNRDPIFTEDREFKRFLWILRAYAARLDCLIYAYCLMSNHLHLLIKFLLGNPDEFMQAVLWKYSRWFNRRHKRAGHLFQDRYYSRVITDESYLHEAGRYIHANPLEARMVSAPEAYRWSSYPAYLAQRPESRLDLGPLSSPFKAGGSFDAKAFAAFTTARWKASRAKGKPSPETRPQEGGDPEGTIARVAAFFGLTPDDLGASGRASRFGLARAVAMEALSELHHWKYGKIARRFEVRFEESVARAIRRARGSGILSQVTEPEFSAQGGRGCP